MVRGLKQARLWLPGVGERAALVAEQAGLDQRLGDGGAVLVDEWPTRAPAGAMDRGRHEPFAAARLAQNEDGRRATRGLGLTPEQPGELIADSPHP